MKKIGLLILLVLLLAACRPNKNITAYPAQHAVQTTQIATQGLSVVGHWQSLILMLLMLFLVVPLVLAACLLIRCLTLWKRHIRRIGSGRWIEEPAAYWKKSDEPDLYQQILLEQQWLFSQLPSQNQEEVGIHDLSEPPMDGWG